MSGSPPSPGSSTRSRPSGAPPTVDFRTARAVATATFDPATARFPPLFAVRADGVTVVSE
jgi:hypothetical protein